MAVVNGQQANQTTFNTAFMSRTQDTSTVGKVDLENTDVASGANIDNAQRELNKLNTFAGSTVNTPAGSLPSWANLDVGSSSDSLFARADALTAKFNAGSGHAHSGAPGDGAPISAGDLTDYNDYWAEMQTVNLTGAAGLSDDVTSLFSGETPNGGASAVGIPTTPPYSRVELRTNPAGDQIEEPGGKKVYGRLTESSGTWTLTYYYTDSLGIETAYSLPTQDIKIYYREVFSSATRPTFGTDEGFIGSLDATADVVDATTTQSGKVSTVAQSFGGRKTFADGAIFTESIAIQKEDVASTAIISALSSTNSFVKITGATATELRGISAPSEANLLVVYNASSAVLTVKHQNVGATAGDRIITPEGGDVQVQANQSVQFLYDITDSRWRLISASGSGGGGDAYQESIGTGDGVSTSFGPLTNLPTSEDAILVMLNGLPQDTANWSLSGADVVFTFAPATGTDVYVYYLTDGTPTPSGPTGTQEVEYRTLTVGEAAAESLTLSATPLSASKVMLDAIGGGAQEYGVDYTVSGTTLSWAGLGLAGSPAGTKFRINYLS